MSMNRYCLPAEFKTRAVIHNCQKISLQYSFNRTNEQSSQALKVQAICFDCQVLTVHHLKPEALFLQQQAVIFDSQVLSVQLPFQPEDDSSKQTTAMHRQLSAHEEPEFKTRAVMHKCQVKSLQYTCSRDSGHLSHSLKAHALCFDCPVLTVYHMRPETR